MGNVAKPTTSTTTTSDGNANDPDAIHTNVAAEISTIDEKTVPANADLVVVEDSENSFIKKKVQLTNLPTGGGGDTDAIHDNVAAEISVLTEKVTPVSGDHLLIEDSADSNNKKRVQVGSLPSSTDATAIHDDTAGEIAAVTEKGTPVSGDLLLIEDSAAANAKKRVQIGNLPTGSDTDAIHDNVASEISAVTEKASPVSGDLILIEDSADSNNKKRVQVGNLPTGSDAAAIHDDTANEIAIINPKVTPTSSDYLIIEDAADSNNKKSITIGDLPNTSSDTDAIHDNVAAEISLVTEKASPVSGDLLLIEDSADSNNKKRVQVGNLPTGASKPSSGVVYPEDFANLTESVINTCETTTGWSAIDNVTSIALDATNKTEGSNSVGCTMEASWAQITTPDSSQPALYFDEASDQDAGNAAYMAFDVFSLVANSHPGSSASDGSVSRWDLVVASSAGLVNIHSRIEVRGFIDTSTALTFVVPLTNKTYRSYGLQQQREYIGLTTSRPGFRIDNIRLLAAPEDVVALESTGAGVATAVIVEPNATLTPDPGEEYAEDRDAKVKVDLREKWRTINWFRGHRHTRDYWSSDWEDGSQDMWEKLNRLFRSIDDGDTLEFTPGAFYAIDTDDPVSLSRKNDLRLMFNGAKLGSTTEGRTDSFIDVSQCNNVELNDLWIPGPLGEIKGSTVNGSTFTEDVATTAINGTTRELQTQNSAASIAFGSTNLLVPNHDGWFHCEITLSSDEAATQCYIDIYDQDGNQMELPTDGIQITDNTTGLRIPAYRTQVGLSQVTFDIKWKQRRMDLSQWVRVTNLDATATVTIHSAAAWGLFTGGGGNDDAHGLDILGSNHTTVRNLRGWGIESDLIHVAGNAANTLIDGFWGHSLERQGISDVQSYRSTWRNGMLFQSGRSLVDFEPFTAGHTCTEIVLEQFQGKRPWLGALTAANTDTIINGRFTDLILQCAHGQNVMNAGGIGCTYDNIIHESTVIRATGVASQAGGGTLVGRDLRISNITMYPDQATLTINDSATEESDQTIVNNIVGRVVVNHSNAIVNNVRTQSRHTSTDLANWQPQARVPMQIDDYTKDIFFSNVSGGPIGIEYYTHQYLAEAPASHTPDFIAGLNMRQKRPIKGVMGLAASIQQRNNFHGTETSVNRASASPLTVTFPVRSDIQDNDNDSFANPTASANDTGGDLPAATQYFYKVAYLHHTGGSLNSNLAETNATTPSGAADNTITITVPDMRQRYASAGAWGYLVKGIRIWRGTSTGVYDRYVDIRPDESSDVGITGAYWDTGDVGQDFTDEGSTGVQIVGTEHTDFSGYANSGLFTWITTNVPDDTTDLTGEEPDTNYQILLSSDIDSTGFTNLRADTYTRTGFTIRWDNTDAGTGTIRWTLIGD